MLNYTNTGTVEVLTDYTKTPSEQVITDTAANLTSNGFNVIVVKDRAAALREVTKLLTPEETVMTGSSTTLNEIGFTEALASGKLQVHDLHKDIMAENDEIARADLRRKSVTADIFLASVNAVTEDGKLVAVDASGSRTGALLFAAKKLILVVSVDKIVPDLDAALSRIQEYVLPLEDQRAMLAYKMHTSLNKYAILGKDRPGRTNVILVQEKLGF